ncbi:helix-turn-helix domain-containing protein [Citrobacter farmeri]
MKQAAIERHYTGAERLIAQALNMRPEDVWPQRYRNKKTGGERNECERQRGGEQFQLSLCIAVAEGIHQNIASRRIQRKGTFTPAQILPFRLVRG